MKSSFTKLFLAPLVVLVLASFALTPMDAAFARGGGGGGGGARAGAGGGGGGAARQNVQPIQQPGRCAHKQ